MAERAVVAAIILLITISICLFVTESFIPLGKNLDFRDVCRGYLMKMEYNSGLCQNDCQALESELERIGFYDIEINAPASAKAGTVMSLNVNVTFIVESITGIFSRREKEYEMAYSRNVLARKVVNR